MTQGIPSWLEVSPEVADALVAGRPVVALESAVITHGLPQPINLELARQVEKEILAEGVQPATVAVLQGKVHVGVSSENLEHLALAVDMQKISRRDLSVAAAKYLSGGTTVAASMIAAQAAGVRVFTTGGIGGVHRGDAGDVSADLPELAQTSLVVVCAGAKSILDLPCTLEWLETAGVPVIGWETLEFPAFFSRESGLQLNVEVRSASEAAAIAQAHWRLGLESGLVFCVPCPEEAAMSLEAVEEVISKAEVEAQVAGITGKELTPYLLDRISLLTDGASLRANLALLRNNAQIAAQIAKVLSGL
jgi:pseudouridine-5'-phosphate glycosidase